MTATNELKITVHEARQSRELENLFIEQNMKLVHSCIRRRYMRAVRNQEDYEEIAQCGMIGLMKAVRGFNFSFDVEFSTYAVPKIEGEISRYLRDDMSSYPMHIPRSARAISKDYKRFEDLGYTEEEIAKGLKINIRELGEVLNKTCKTVSIHSPVGQDKSTGKDMFLEEILTDPNQQYQLEDRVVGDEARRIIMETLREITSERDVNIMKLRARGLSQQEVANALGLGQVHVSRILAKIKLCIEYITYCINNDKPINMEKAKRINLNTVIKTNKKDSKKEMVE
jgi:RNA polymerase sigma factor (sigma-70 family)